MVIVAGLDPSGTPRRYTGLTIIDDHNIIYIGRLKHDEEIINTILRYKPVVVAIDSPLSYADGYREVDLCMKKLGFKVLPPGWRSMRMLISRSLAFKEVFERNNITVIETHPLSAFKSSNCASLEELTSKFKMELPRKPSKDEADSLIAALVAYSYITKSVFKVEAHDGIIYLLPKICGE